MKCPKCQTENRAGAKFCSECGENLEMTCPRCKKATGLGSKFCDECGYKFEAATKGESAGPEWESERKYVTVLFSDLCGYTTLSEKLDPEETKEIMGRVFGEISQVVTRYEGFIEKFIGDAVMALFGVPRTHEDDPVRAIKAAREIHRTVSSLSSQYEQRIGDPLAMHAGICTGLVITGEVNHEKGTHGILGDTINTASRLAGLAKPGEILVSLDTYRQAEGHFTFEALEPAKLKGKAEPVQMYRVLLPKARPITIHRLSGRRAQLIGRVREIKELSEALHALRKGKGRIFSICGDAGTGKSRLVEDFKATLDLRAVQWLEGHAYAYAQNIPYFPLIDLFNRVFQIDEGDRPEHVKKKIESGLEELLGTKGEAVPYVGSLYSIPYPEVDGISPEFWKTHLKETVLTILAALAKRSLTVFLAEDLHWADPSYVELLRQALLEIRQPAMVLCVYRPTFSLFTHPQTRSLSKVYQEIRLQDLSLSEAQEMLKSLLKAESIPSDLKGFVQDKAEGNPFYLEELVNSLIESDILAEENGRWRITRPITETDISPTIHGLISGRLDRLEKGAKRTLQEASVIGRTFLYEILKRITTLEEGIDRNLGTLEQVDLIRRALGTDLEYVFKHALTQEVAYAGLTRRDRYEIHERIGQIIEVLFEERLPEFYETLAYHFKNGQSILKAIDYLVKAGKKCLARYAVEEAHQYFREAFDILSSKKRKTKEDEVKIIALLNEWGLVFYFRGDYKTLLPLLSEHRPLAESLEDQAMRGIYYCWLGMALFHVEDIREGYDYLKMAFRLGEQANAKKVMAFAALWLTWICAEMGLLDEAIVWGGRAREMARFLESEDLYCLTLAGLGQAYWYRGDVKKALETGQALLEHSQRLSNVRGTVLGHYIIGCSRFISGDFSSAVECYERSISCSADPYYTQWPKMLLCLTYVLSGRNQEAENILQDVLRFTDEFGVKIIGTPAHSIMGIVLVGRGHLEEGIQIYEEGRRAYTNKERRWCLALSEYLLGTIYLELIKGNRQKGLSLRNLFFVFRNLPFLSKKAERHFNRSIEIAEKIQAKVTLGMAYLNLGVLYKFKRKRAKARDCFAEAIEVFEHCDVDIYANQAKEALASLG